VSFASAFSPDYGAARARFRAAAHAMKANLEVLSIGQKGPDGDDLTIDMACVGSRDPKRAVVVSSGLHGVEGFFGSACQAALLEDTLGGWAPPKDGALILLHALNPYGFAWMRRVNEDNIDLNRNFLRAGEGYEGSPEKYGDLDALLNPPRPPGSVMGFLPKAVFNIGRHGMPALKQAVAGGQYDFPKGLFFGGRGPSVTKRLLETHMPKWLPRAERVFHIDFHTGLGKAATYKLFVDHEWGSPGYETLAAKFGDDVVEPWEPKEGVSYEIRGGLGNWCKATFPNTNYDVLAAEFGTVNVLQVIAALHMENRAHHFGDPDSAAFQKAKQGLYRAFAPEAATWRTPVVKDGVRIVEQALEAAFS
jgi:hypothetical protein